MILLPLPPKCWDYRRALLCPPFPGSLNCPSLKKMEAADGCVCVYVCVCVCVCVCVHVEHLFIFICAAGVAHGALSFLGKHCLRGQRSSPFAFVWFS
jgi:hypothetical protein